MSAAAILTELRNQGLSVRANGDKVSLSPRERVSPELLERVRANKPAIPAHINRRLRCTHLAP